MKDTKNDLYWWCPTCEKELSDRRVTFEETCDTCGTDVELYKNKEGPLFE